MDDIAKLSYVQVLLIQHSAAFNRLLLDKRLEEGRKKDKLTPTEELADGAPRMDQISSDEIMAMAASRGIGVPRTIKTKKDPAHGNPPPPE